MKKVILFATACLFVAGASFAHTTDKGKKKKCAKGKTCCTKDAKAKTAKSCCKDKATAKI